MIGEKLCQWSPQSALQSPHLHKRVRLAMMECERAGAPERAAVDSAGRCEFVVDTAQDVQNARLI
jgi:hypothetical protein